MKTTEQSDKKLFLGGQLRRIRRDQGLTQTQMAHEIGVSTSYLNLMERNQRPLTRHVISKLTERFDVDIDAMKNTIDTHSTHDLIEITSDPLLKELRISKQEASDMASLNPNMTSAFRLLYGAYAQLRERMANDYAHISDRDIMDGTRSNPLEWVRDYIHTHQNHFPTLDAHAEEISAELRLNDSGMFTALRERLKQKHSTTVQIVSVDAMPNSLRRYDQNSQKIMISELMTLAGRTFQLAFHLGLMEAEDVINAKVKESLAPNNQAHTLLRISLANYWAAAVIMPYDRFLEAAETLEYDINVLCQRFNASFEQVCHRLTTLQKPTARGIPFFMVRIDHAGNVSKRFSALPFPFARVGGTCPLWNIHTTFEKPQRIQTQIVELPDGTRYFSVARTVEKAIAPFGAPSPTFAIAIGCELKYAQKLTYARGLDLKNPRSTKIGINCRLCARPNCAQRAAPPLRAELLIDEDRRSISPFLFE